MSQFSQQTFSQALKQTNKIKTNLKPFLSQFTQQNTNWIYSAISILHYNLTQPSVDVVLKMNSMFAIKCIVDITQHISLSMIEAYILPSIVEGAMTDTQEEDGNRGIRFFGVGAEKNLESFGFNYVKVCTELVLVLAVIKPRKLYFDQPTNDPSKFALAKQELSKALKYPASDLTFFKQPPENLKKNYEASLNKIKEDSESYEKFVQEKFYQQLKIGFAPLPKKLDITPLIELGDMFIMIPISQILGDALLKGKTCNIIRFGLGFLNKLVISGCQSISLLFHDSQPIKLLVKAAIDIPGNNTKLSRGDNFLPTKNGTPQQRRQLYTQFLRSLQFWANTYLKTPIKGPQKSNISKYYHLLKNDHELEFPQNPNLQKQIKMTEDNCKLFANGNKIFLSEIVKKDDVKNQRANSVIGKPKKQESTSKVPSQPKMSTTKIVEEQSKKQSVANQSKNSLKNGSKENIKKIEETSIKKSETPNPDASTKSLQRIQLQKQRSLQQGEIQRQKSVSRESKSIHKTETDKQKSKQQIQVKQFEKIKSNSNFNANSNSRAEVGSRVASAANNTNPSIQKAVQGSKNRLSNGEVYRADTRSRGEDASIQRGIGTGKKGQSGSIPQLQNQEEYHDQDYVEVDEDSQHNYPRDSPNKNVQFSRSNKSENLPQPEYNPITNQNPNPNQQHYPSPILNRSKNPIHQSPSNQHQSPINEIYKTAQQRILEQDDDQIIQSPHLSPLDQSYHDIQEVYEEVKASKNFRDVINSEKLFIKSGKKQAMFWMNGQSQSLIKPVPGSQKRSRIQPTINVPQLLNQRTKKHQIQLQLIQHQKKNQIQLLQKKLHTAQREKSQITQKLKQKQYQIRSLKQNSQIGGGPARSHLQHDFNLVDDQNYVMKKMMDNKSVSNNGWRDGYKVCSRVLAPGEIIDTRVFQAVFQGIGNQKDKKRHMKNKELLYKVTGEIQIGFMGHLEDDRYLLTLYITPQQQFALVSYELAADLNKVSITHNISQPLSIPPKKQQRLQFSISPTQIPYPIPKLSLTYKLSSGKHQSTCIDLPCCYHKFFKIGNLSPQENSELDSKYLITRGQEIPYSKRLIKNLEILQELLPRVERLSEGRANQFGEVCFGGVCVGVGVKFPIKVCVKPNQFLYIKTMKQTDRELALKQNFYVATLNHLLQKDVQWK